MAALLAHSTLIQAIVFLVRPSITYQAIALDVPLFALGALAATFAIVPLALAIPAGGWVDRFGERIAMVIGSGTVVIAGVVLLLAGDSMTGLVCGAALLGAGHLGCIVGQQTVVANTSHEARLDAMFGYYTFAASLGQAIGPLLIPLAGGAVVEPDTTVLFAVGVGMSAVLFVLTFAIRRVPRRTQIAIAPPNERALSILKLPGVARAMATSAIIVAAVDLTVVYIPALAAERGLTACDRWHHPRDQSGLLDDLAPVPRSRLGEGGPHSPDDCEHRALCAHPRRNRHPAAPLGAIPGRCGVGPWTWRGPTTHNVVVDRADPAGTPRPRSLPQTRRKSPWSGRHPGRRRCRGRGLGAGAVLVTIGVLLGTTLLLLRGVRLDGDER